MLRFRPWLIRASGPCFRATRRLPLFLQALGAFYKDLTDPDFTTNFCVYHRRFRCAHASSRRLSACHVSSRRRDALEPMNRVKILVGSARDGRREKDHRVSAFGTEDERLVRVSRLFFGMPRRPQGPEQAG